MTTVAWRKQNLIERLERSAKLVNGEETLKLDATGEEGVEQIRAILGLRELVTNVNLPNYGQIPNLPYGAVVETNAVFSSGSVIPVFAGKIPDSIYPLIARISGEQEMIAKAGKERNLNLAFSAFLADPLTTIDAEDAKKLFDAMVANTKAYLKDYQ